ncbi:MAG: polysaccharide biosynthesis/export family protein [Verrucomicrobiota bacterium]
MTQRILFCLLGLFTCLTSLKAQVSKDHLLAPGDTIEVNVFQEPDLDAKVILSKDGNVTLRLIGDVMVQGKTTSQAAQAITLKYKDGFLVNPNVTVSVVGYAQRRFTILGAVIKPASYYFPEGEPINLLQAIGLAGGYSRVASPSKITIKRGKGGTVIKVDKAKIESYLIQPNDIINIGESFL